MGVLLGFCAGAVVGGVATWIGYRTGYSNGWTAAAVFATDRKLRFPNGSEIAFKAKAAKEPLRGTEGWQP